MITFLWPLGSVPRYMVDHRNFSFLMIWSIGQVSICFRAVASSSSVYSDCGYIINGKQLHTWYIYWQISPINTRMLSNLEIRGGHIVAGTFFCNNRVNNCSSLLIFGGCVQQCGFSM